MYVLNYDESSHLRKLTIKNGKPNMYNDNESDDFVYAFIGYRQEDEESLLKEFNEFESESKKILGIPDEIEFKGTNIKKKNFNYGMASMMKDNSEVYNRYFNKLSDNRIFIHIGIMSKTEYIIDQIMDKWIFKNKHVMLLHNVEIVRFKYVVSKFIYNHRYEETFMGILKNDEINMGLFKSNLLKLLKEVIKYSDGYKRTTAQVSALREVHTTIRDMSSLFNISINKDWDYSTIFKGLQLFLSVKGIKKEEVILNVDRERNTKEEAISQGFLVSRIEESHLNIQLRFADFLANFSSRLLTSLSSNFKEPEIKEISDISKTDYKTKRYLKSAWFRLREDQYNIYKQLNDKFLQDLNYYTVYTGYLFDSTIVFIGIVQYIAYEYKTYREFLEVDIKEHQERFNTYYMYKMTKQHSRLKDD